MDLENHVVIPIVERALAMSAVAREHWCVEWARWLWSQEIEIAVYEAKRAAPQTRLGRRQPIAGDPAASDVYWVASANDEALSPGGRVHHKPGEPPPEWCTRRR